VSLLIFLTVHVVIRVHLSVVLTANTLGMNRLNVEDIKFVFNRVSTVAVVSRLLCIEEVPGLNLERSQTLVNKLLSFCSVVSIKYRK